MTAGDLGVSVTRAAPRGRLVVITALGLAQILAWGSSYYLLAVLAKPIARDTGWPLAWIVGGVSLGLLSAAVASPRVGRAIERRGGRPILIASSIMFALGFVALALAQSIPAYLGAWIIIGIAMGAGLYDPAFATLGKLYGVKARGAITTLTLFGGFASTTCWPLSAFFEAELGWRGTCIAYAALHLIVALPLYWFGVPRHATGDHPNGERPVGSQGNAPAAIEPSSRDAKILIGFLAVTITLNAMISTVLSIHLLTVLQARGITMLAAVTLGTMVGPSQVGARLIEMLIARYHHPIWTKIASTLFVLIGISALWSGTEVIAGALVFYGAGAGLESIARGTLPLALFGAKGYATLMGRLAIPSLTAQAAAPSIGAVLLDSFGANDMLGVLVTAAGVNALLAAVLFVLIARARAERAAPNASVIRPTAPPGP